MLDNYIIIIYNTTLSYDLIRNQSFTVDENGANDYKSTDAKICSLEAGKAQMAQKFISLLLHEVKVMKIVLCEIVLLHIIATYKYFKAQKVLTYTVYTFIISKALK